MKKLSLIPVLLLFVLSFSSCDFTDYEKLYESGSYQELLDITTEVLHEKLPKKPLYYNMLANYRLGNFEDAVQSATLYQAMYNNRKDEELINACRILLYYSDTPALALEGGRQLFASSSNLLTNDYISYFTALMKNGNYEEAANIYNNVRGQISAKTAAQMCIAGQAASSLIASNLDAWYSQEGSSLDFRDSLIQASQILLSRGEGELILQLARSIFSSQDSEIALVLGDIYREIGDSSAATNFYSIAYKDYPRTVSSRLANL